MSASAITSLALLNAASSDDAQTWFMQTCTAEKWCAKMVKQRPFLNFSALITAAGEQWHEMTTLDFIQAFTGHPMIGDLSTLRQKFASTKAIASNEQSGTQSATEVTLQNLQKMNHEYVNKHGFIFNICASGLSAAAMLNELKLRIHNSTGAEIEKAAQEQIKITLLRINKAFDDATA